MADGTVKQEIKIYYNSSALSMNYISYLQNGGAAMPAKNCTVCGVEYVPGSGASRYCPACAKKIRRRNQTRANAGAENRKG